MSFRQRWNGTNPCPYALIGIVDADKQWPAVDPASSGDMVT